MFVQIIKKLGDEKAKKEWEIAVRLNKKYSQNGFDAGYKSSMMLQKIDKTHKDKGGRGYQKATSCIKMNGRRLSCAKTAISNAYPLIQSFWIEYYET